MAEARPRIPRPLALGIVGALFAATLVALFWSSLPLAPAPRTVVGPTRVGVITRQIETGAPAVGEQAPEFEWVAPDGRTVRLSSLRGHPVVMNFWATWCVPCKTEMPLLDRAAAADPATPFLAVDLDEDGGTVRGYFDDRGIAKMEPLIDVGLATARHYAVLSVPTTFFIDAGGTIRYVRIGELDAAKLQSGLDALR